MRLHRYTADAIGLLVLAILAALVAWVIAAVYNTQNAVWAFIVGLPILGICALIAWHSNKWPADWQTVLIFALGSILVGAAFLLTDGLIGGSTDPQVPFRNAIWRAGSPFGILLTIAVCPCFTLIALSGTVRGLLLAIETDSQT